MRERKRGAVLKVFAHEKERINQSKKCKPAENIMKLKYEEVFVGGKLKLNV